MTSRCEDEMLRFVGFAILTASIAAGCSETPSAAVPSTTPATDAVKVESDPVDSGDENGPAISKPLEEPPVESPAGESTEIPSNN